MNLARKYRPAHWIDFVGQRPAVWTLYQTAQRGKLPNAILLHGERGCGKTSAARVIAKSLNCASEVRTAREWPCGKCQSCLAIAEGSSIDVTEVDAATNGSVDTVRTLIEQAGYSSPGRARVFIIDEAHAASRAAFEAMLKTLEEPALEGQVFFILVTTRPSVIPETVKSRCHRYRFDPLPGESIRQRLELIVADEGIKAGDGLLAAIAQAARGALRDAIMMLDQAASAGISDVRLWRELAGTADFAPGLLAAAAAADYPGMYAILDGAMGGDPARVARELIFCLEDMLILGSPGGHIALDGEALAARQELAGRLGPERTLTVMQVLWDLHKVKTGDPRADLVLAVSTISRRLAPPGAAAGPIVPAESGQGALSRLRGVLGATSDQSGPV